VPAGTYYGECAGFVACVGSLPGLLGSPANTAAKYFIR
jgi:hypothetical protein